MGSDSDILEARIDELEVRLAQQDQASLDFSDEVYRQQRQIAGLELEIRHLNERLEAIELRQSTTAPADDVPPHY